MAASDAVAVAMTGASGALYGIRLVELLLQAGVTVDLVLSATAPLVVRQECDLSWEGPAERVGPVVREHFAAPPERLRLHDPGDWRSALASGSGGPRALAVCPCSMGNLAAMACGRAENLIQRAADVMLKEGRPLILVPRETPYNALHLENMLRLQRAGAIILPASPAFYHRPRNVADLVDTVVGRILDRLAIPHPGPPPWPGGS